MRIDIPEPRQYAQVGELWEFSSREPNETIYDHYLVLQINFDDKWHEYHYKALHLETGEIIPDLIIDKSSFVNYNATMVA
jgi:hypothetical protein